MDRVWVTEAIRPGVVACSHHLGRWRLKRGARRQPLGHRRSSTSSASRARPLAPAPGRGHRRRSRARTPTPSASGGSDGGVHQNLTFPVHPDPVSGMHCWHQKVRVEPARRRRPLRRRVRRHRAVAGGLPGVAGDDAAGAGARRAAAAALAAARLQAGRLGLPSGRLSGAGVAPRGGRLSLFALRCGVCPRRRRREDACSQDLARVVAQDA